MTIPLMVLAVLSVFGGILNLPGIVFHNAGHWMTHFLESTTYGLNQIKPEHMDGNQSIILMCVASAVALGVLAWSYSTYVKKQALAKEDAEMNAWEKLSSNKLYIDEIYQTVFAQPILWLSTTLASQFEQRILNNGIFKMTSAIEASGNYTRKWQSGFLASYLFWMVMGIIGFISYYIIKSSFWN
jgi:NADH-quinone oxidoreductase subunit L